jgi:AcrR family transcriptional regulator
MVALLHSAASAARLGDDAMSERILDATVAELVDFGLRRFSVEDVARRAGINRITIYRRFASKDLLLQAVLVREGQRLFAEVDGAIAGLRSPAEQIVEGFTAVLMGARRHPLVRRMLTVDPDTFGSLLMTHGGTLVAVAREYLAGHARRLTKGRKAAPFDPDIVAELAVRLSLSFLITPESRVALDTDDEARAFARSYLVPALAPMTGARPQRQGAERVDR